MGKKTTHFTFWIFILTLGFSASGQQLHTHANAASIANEANATTGWIQEAAPISSVNGGAQLGTFFLRLTSSASAGQGSRRMSYTFPAQVGQEYEIRIRAREGTQVSANPQPAFASWVGVSGFTTQVISGTQWTEYVFTVTATTTQPLIRVWTGNTSTQGVAGNRVEIDNVSILPAGTDTTAPSAPANLVSSNITANSANLSWTAATDNVGVTNYRIYNNGSLLTPTGGTGTNFLLPGLNPSTSYNLTLRAVDAAGNESANSNIAAFVTSSNDTQAPSVSISSSASSPTNTSPIPLTITFDEPVTGFVLSDLTVGNGTAGNFSGSGASYSASITPGGNGSVTVNIAANAASDAAGNGNTAAPQFSIVSDTSPPTLQISSSAGSPTNTSPIPVTLTFNETVTGLQLTDLVVGNGSAGNLSGTGANYTVNITPAGNGTVTVDLPTGVVSDAAGNGNTAATQFSIQYSSAQPSVLISSLETSPTNNAPIPISITFNEAVTGFTLGDLVVANGSAANFSGSGASYTANINPAGNGLVTVDIPVNSAVNGVGNGNTAAPQFSIDFDGTSPTVLLASTESSPTSANPIPLTITFNEAVSGFTQSDLNVGNGSAANFSGSGASYSANITPAGDGTVTVNVAAGAATDSAGNGNTVAPQFSIVYEEADSQPPDPVSDLSALNITDSRVDLSWSAPFDNVGVTDYEVFRDGSSLGFTGGSTAKNISGLDPETSYIFTVYAQDEAGNVSGISNIVTVNTTEVHYTTANANLTTVDWRTRDLLVSGNLGIGTTNTQGYLLAVAGGAIAESMKVELQSNWPDFVFLETYPLPSLTEVERHIEVQGHLIGIPSAAEVAENGIDLGDMDARLLQKIEELTLYTLQQEKRIQDLEQENRELQQLWEKVKALEEKSRE